MDGLGLDWQADAVHSNDWQTGLVSAFLQEEMNPPKTVFTIHNLSYGGHFPPEVFYHLHLPVKWWSTEGIEFYGGFSMLKAGIVYSDAVTTVSATYAKEICTPAFGMGMDGVLQSNQAKLFGILNGIDTKAWNPSTDQHLVASYSAKRRNPGKKKNKQALLEYFGIAFDDAVMQAPLLGMVSRLVDQKGVDLVLDAIPQLLGETDANFLLVGNGNDYYEQRIVSLSEQYPGRVMNYIGYSEHLAHLLEAGADMFLMPSRFEPCGLNQMYSLAYGTPPIVNHTGGLADTVIDSTEENLKNGTANGFVMSEATLAALLDAARRAINLFSNTRAWQQLQRNGMLQDFSWDHSALEYMNLYRR
jgi:starch synthase